MKGKIDMQRAPNTMQHEKGVDLTASMDGKLMLHVLRAKPHKVPLIEELHLKGMRDAHVRSRHAR
jgi:hypothetical protein